MKTALVLALAYCMHLSAWGQYYYKDIVITSQVQNQWKQFRSAQVKDVTLQSVDANGKAAEGFHISQSISPDYSFITTTTETSTSQPSALTTWYDANGRPVKTLDTSDTYQSRTEYIYDASNHIINITNISTETDNKTEDREVHEWHYDAHGRVAGMTRIKNNIDTTEYSFACDEKGNVTVEKGVHVNELLPTVYYYYDGAGRLTDVVRYNPRAKKLLPDYVFEYNGNGQVISMLMVPEGTTDYQRWEYAYLQNGLKSADACYDKQRNLMGRVEYRYSLH